jgi:hypothetical protein
MVGKKRVYTKWIDGVRFRAVVGDRANGERIISFYSNRNAPEEGLSRIPITSTSGAGSIPKK